MMLDARKGRGCHHCETGIPVERILTRRGELHLCLACVLAWFPGKDVSWWESHHAPYRDHLDHALKEAAEREWERVQNSRGRESPRIARNRPGAGI